MEKYKVLKFHSVGMFHSNNISLKRIQQLILSQNSQLLRDSTLMVEMILLQNMMILKSLIKLVEKVVVGVEVTDHPTTQKHQVKVTDRKPSRKMTTLINLKRNQKVENLIDFNLMMTLKIRLRPKNPKTHTTLKMIWVLKLPRRKKEEGKVAERANK